MSKEEPVQDVNSAGGTDDFRTRVNKKLPKKKIVSLDRAVIQLTGVVFDTLHELFPEDKNIEKHHELSPKYIHMINQMIAEGNPTIEKKDDATRIELLASNILETYFHKKVGTKAETAYCKDAAREVIAAIRKKAEEMGVALGGTQQNISKNTR